MVSFPFINFYSLVRSVLLTSLSGATEAEGQRTEVTATDVKAISTGRSQIIFANGVEVRKITCADDGYDEDDETTITSKSKHPLTLTLTANLKNLNSYCNFVFRILSMIASIIEIEKSKIADI